MSFRAKTIPQKTWITKQILINTFFYSSLFFTWIMMIIAVHRTKELTEQRKSQSLKEDIMSEL